MFWNSKSRLSVVSVYHDSYEAHARLRPGSVKRYRCELNRWQRHVGDLAISSIETEHFELFRSACLRAGLKPDTIESTVKIVKAVLRYCRDRGWINRLPVFGKPLPSDPPEPEPVTTAEFNALMRAANHSTLFGSGLRSPAVGFQSWLAIGYWTGLRLMDLSCNLAPKHLRWADGCIKFRASKTGARHVFPITPIVEYHLRRAETGATPDSLFGVRAGHLVDRELARLCLRAGIRKITAKHIRQASVTEWDRLGCGHLVHGCGLSHGEKVPRVMRHYLGVLRRLNAVADRFEWPEEMLPPAGEQLTLRLHG